ncbi:MAG: hypothetical protein JJ958_10975 [Balneola sp.]|jgi:hypothetical protein|nr:hypothetical protein [Balneola sp.]
MNIIFKCNTTIRGRKSLSVTTLLVCGLLVLSSCSKPSSVNSDLDLSQNTDDLLNPNISFQISYDQKSMVFTPFWPGDVVAGFKAKSSSEDTEMLIDYDYTKEYVAIDQDKNMHFQIDYLEGTSSQGIPDDLYSEVKDEMPNRSDDKQVISTQISNGLITYQYSDGTQLSENIDPSELAITEEAYEYWRSLFENKQDTSASAKISKNLNALKQSGISFQQLDGSTVYFELQPGADERPDIGRIRQKMDLETGDILMSVTQFKDGRYESVSYMNYKLVGNISVLQNSETYVFGPHQGEWQAVQKHVINRENISIATNFGE